MVSLYSPLFRISWASSAVTAEDAEESREYEKMARYIVFPQVIKFIPDLQFNMLTAVLTSRIVILGQYGKRKL